MRASSADDVNERARSAERRFEIPTLIAAAVVIPALLLDDADRTGALGSLPALLNWAVWAVFAAEAVVMLCVVDHRGRWLREHPLEVVVVLLTFPLLGTALGGVRVLRLLRLLRLVRVAQIGRRLFSTNGLRDVGLLVLLAVVAAGQAFSQLEPHKSLGDGIYWAVTTLTTVGYGDELPTTTAAPIIAIALMITGVGFAGLLTGAIAERFVRSDLAKASAASSTDTDELAEEIASIAARLDELQALLRVRG